MNNKIDSIDFKNSVFAILKEFLTTQYDVDDPLYDVYVSQSYDEVQKAFELMNDSEIPRKPVIHFSLINPKIGSKTYIEDGIEVQRNFMYYSVYCVVDSNIEEGRKRQFVLNELSDSLKAKFNRYENNLDEFMRIDINAADRPLGANSDGLWAIQQTLQFVIDKRV